MFEKPASPDAERTETGARERLRALGRETVCVIPTHARPRRVIEAIKSVLLQSVAPGMILVVDDVGDAETAHKVDQISKSSEDICQINYVTSVPGAQERGSAGRSRNIGAARSSSAFIAFLDDDDRWQPGFLESCLSQIQDSKTDLAVTWTAQFAGSTPSGRGLRIDDGLSPSEILAKNPGLTGSNFVVRKTAFDTVGGFDANLPVANDLDFLVRFLDQGFTYRAIEQELVSQIAHGDEQLTAPSMARALGWARYCEKYRVRMTRAQRKAATRTAHSIRRFAAPTRRQRLWHRFGQIASSDRHDLVVVAGKLFGKSRGVYHPRRHLPASDHRSSNAQILARRVVHVGIVGEYPGGMAQVINQYMTWKIPGHELSGLLSTRGQRDPLSPLLMLRSAVRLCWMALRGHADTTVVHLSEGGSFVREGLLLLLSRSLGIHTVAHLHGAVFVDFFNKHPTLVGGVLRRAQAVAVLSDESKSVVQQIVSDGVPVHLVRNGVCDEPGAPFNDRSRTIFFGGEVGRRKGADLLGAAWAQVQKVRPDWRLEIAGPVREGQSHGLLSLVGVSYLGVLTNDALLNRLASARIAVLPSRAEAFPMFLLEALAKGCVIIASDVGQANAAVSNENGWLIEPGSADDLRAALMEATTHPTLASMSARSRYLFNRDFSRDAVQRELVSFWAAEPQRTVQ